MNRLHVGNLKDNNKKLSYNPDEGEMARNIWEIKRDAQEKSFILMDFYPNKLPCNLNERGVWWML